MRVDVDRDLCVAGGQCVLAAPAVFDQDDDEGTVVLLEAAPDDAAADVVRRAALLCPAGAITLTP